MDHEEDGWDKGRPEPRSRKMWLWLYVVNHAKLENLENLIVNSLLQARILLPKTLLLAEVSFYPIPYPSTFRQGRPPLSLHPAFKFDFLWLYMEDKSRQGACSECQ